MTSTALLPWRVANNPIICMALQFEPDLVTPKWAVAYAYCDETHQLDALFAARNNGTLLEFYDTLPFLEQKGQISCGNWDTPSPH